MNAVCALCPKVILQAVSLKTVQGYVCASCYKTKIAARVVARV